MDGKYKPEYCEKIIDHGKQGLSFESFAAVIGISRQTLYNWVKTIPEFSEAKDKALACRMLLLEKLIISAASGKLKGANGAMLNLLASNILGWRQDPAEDNSPGARTVTVNVAYDVEKIKKEIADEESSARSGAGGTLTPGREPKEC